MTGPASLTVDMMRRAIESLRETNMGCDIHMFVEFGRGTSNDGDQLWDCFGGMYNPGRDYHMFENLAGVRGDIGESLFGGPRGLPEGQLSWETRHEMNEAEGDFHSHSWLTADEYAACYAKRMLTNEWGPPDLGYELIMVVLQTLKEREVPARVVFAFDN